MTLSQYNKIVGTFEEGTKIMIYRDYVDISNIQYKIIDLSDEETTVQLTSKGLKELHERVYFATYDYVVDDLENRLHFGIEEDLDPLVYNQIRDLINTRNMKPISNSEVEKYEGENYWIYYDRSIVQYGCWVFVDTQIGHMETFNNKHEAFDYLQQYHLEYLKDREVE